MKKLMMAMACAVSAATVMAGLYGDTPTPKHAWAVHDMNRPNPKKVSAEPGVPPSDAVVLFDGTQESFEKNWCDDKGGPTKWKFVNGTLESVHRAGNICSRQKFGDVQLHVEWQPPAKVEGFGQGRGNSGVFLLGGRYEVQVLDSWETDPDNMKNPNYADGQAGAVYGQNPPLVNPTRKPGEWQVYDIVFHKPVYDGDKLVHPGSLTVFLNGVLVQDHWELEGPTLHCGRTRQQKPADTGSIQFQDHGNPVHFRNVWVREIPSRYANTTHGTFLANEADVMALRRETAAKLFAKVDLKNPRKQDVIAQLFEVVSYDASDRYVAELKAVAAPWLAEIAKWDKATAEQRKGELFHVRNAANVLYRNKVIDDNCTIRNGVMAVINKYGLK